MLGSNFLNYYQKALSANSYYGYNSSTGNSENTNGFLLTKSIIIKGDRKQLKAFEIWICRRMLKISWKLGQSNKYVCSWKSEGIKMHVEYNMATKTDGWGTRLEVKSYYEKLPKEEWRARHSEEERDHRCWVILHHEQSIQK